MWQKWLLLKENNCEFIDDDLKINLINKAILVNQQECLPREIKMSSVGRYMRLLYRIDKDNIVINKKYVKVET